MRMSSKSTQSSEELPEQMWGWSSWLLNRLTVTCACYRHILIHISTMHIVCKYYYTAIHIYIWLYCRWHICIHVLCHKYLSKPTFSDKPNLVPGDMLGVSRLVNDRSSWASLRVDWSIHQIPVNTRQALHLWLVRRWYCRYCKGLIQVHIQYWILYTAMSEMGYSL